MTIIIAYSSERRVPMKTIDVERKGDILFENWI